MRRVIYSLLLLALVSFVFAADNDHPDQEDDVREAVFRYQFDHNASGLQKSAHAYCLALGDNDDDPSGDFMKHFAHNKPPVRKASACHIASSSALVDSRTGKSALLFRITKITRISDTEYRVNGGYYEGNVSSSGNNYTVRKDGEGWSVTEDGTMVISRVNHWS
ncbi:MAG: hypothetical protein WAN17_10905 [Candidatus Sulfotelmatobacter sp.]